MVAAFEKASGKVLLLKYLFKFQTLCTMLKFFHILSGEFVNLEYVLIWFGEDGDEIEEAFDLPLSFLNSYPKKCNFQLN